MRGELTKSFSSAVDTAQRYPEFQNRIVAAAKSSFLQGDEWAYVAGIVAILLGAALIFFLFPDQAQGGGATRAISRGDVSEAAEPAMPPASAGRALP